MLLHCLLGQRDNQNAGALLVASHRGWTRNTSSVTASRSAGGIISLGCFFGEHIVCRSAHM